MLKVKDLSNQASSANKEQEKVDTLNQLSFEFLNSSLERAEEYAREALDLSKNLKYPKGKVEALANLGRIYCRSSKNDEALTFLKEAIHICREHSLDALLGRTYGDISTVYRVIGELDNSLEYAERGLLLLTPENDPKGLRAMNLNCLGNVYHQQGKIDDAYQCYHEGIEILSKAGNRRTAVNMRGNLAVLLSHEGKHRESLEHFQICLEDFKSISHRQGESVTLVNIAFELYNLEEYPKALNHFLKAIRLLKVVENKKSLANAYRGLGCVYTAFNGYDEAYKHFEKSLEVSRNINYAYGTYLGHMALAESLEKQAEKKQAKEHYNKALQLAIMMKWDTKEVESALDNLSPSKGKDSKEKALEV